MPTRSEPTAPEVSRALARSHVYRVLAAAFRPPVDPEAEPLHVWAAAVPGVDEMPEPVRQALARLAAASVAVDTAQRVRDHAAVFGHVVLPDCPLYETAAGATDPFRQPQTLADVVGFYRAWGVEVSPGARERADHLAVELEFMHYLTYREAHALCHAGPDRVALVRDAERAFLGEHLARWAPAVGRAVAARSDGWLGAAGSLLEQFLTWEAATHGLAEEALVLTPEWTNPEVEPTEEDL